MCALRGVRSLLAVDNGPVLASNCTRQTFALAPFGESTDAKLSDGVAKESHKKAKEAPQKCLRSVVLGANKLQMRVFCWRFLHASEQTK